MTRPEETTGGLAQDVSAFLTEVLLVLVAGGVWLVVLAEIIRTP